jgi:hypothetical protein
VGLLEVDTDRRVVVSGGVRTAVERRVERLELDVGDRQLAQVERFDGLRTAADRCFATANEPQDRPRVARIAVNAGL